MECGNEQGTFSVRMVQAESWTMAHRVLQACKQGLTAEKCATQHLVRQANPARSGGGILREIVKGSLLADTVNVERLASAARVLASSLFPDSFVVLLLLDSTTGRLREAGNEGGSLAPDGNISLPLPLRTIQRKDVAQRTLASGKVLLAPADGKSLEYSGVAASGRSTNAGGEARFARKRLVCVPLMGPADKRFGVLQLLLPPCPHSLSVGTPKTGSRRPASPLGEEEQTRFYFSLLSDRPPAFLMTANIVACYIVLALSWCEALGKDEKERVESEKAVILAARSDAEDYEHRLKELSMRYGQEKRDATVLCAEQAVQVDDAHARTIASLLEGKAGLEEVMFSVAARARYRRVVTKALGVWDNMCKQRQNAGRMIARMDNFRYTKAVWNWKKRASLIRKTRMTDFQASTTAERRGLRRAMWVWARFAAQAFINRERRLAGLKLIVEVWRRIGTASRCFRIWKATTTMMAFARKCLAQREAEEKSQKHIMAQNVSGPWWRFFFMKRRQLLVFRGVLAPG